MSEVVEKVVIECPKCKKKMKISLKEAKYRCPHCQEIYHLTKSKLTLLKIKVKSTNVKDNIVGLPSAITNKYKNMKATYKYMKAMQENIKKDPNFSQYYKEQREMKEGERKSSKLKDFFKKK